MNRYGARRDKKGLRFEFQLIPKIMEKIEMRIKHNKVDLLVTLSVFFVGTFFYLSEGVFSLP